MKSRRPLLLAVVFVSGMTTLAVELSASRLLAPYFGTALPVWASLIGLILIYLTVGYYLGGRLADRYPDETILYQLTAWAAFAVGLVPFVARPILRYAVAGLTLYTIPSLVPLVGSFAGVLLLFAIPVTLLGCVSPFAIRLAMREVDSAGNIAGTIYALSTVGSIVGTFLPVLILIPNIGTRNTFLFFSLTLLVISLAGLAFKRSRRVGLYALLAIIIVALAIFFRGGAIKRAEGLLYDTESAYNYIQVVTRGDDIYLKLNEGAGLQSAYNPHRLLTDGIWDYFLIVPYFTPHRTAQDVDSLCLIGLAAGTVSKQYSAVYGPIPIDGVEIDRQIIEVGRKYFAMNEPNLRAIAQDGRYFLMQVEKKYDVIAIDAYRPPYIPFHLTTREFFVEVREHLTDDGVAAINAVRTDTDFRLVDALASTMKSVFSEVYIIDVPEAYNSLIVGIVQPTSLDDFYANMGNISHPLLLEVAERAEGHVRRFEGSFLILTDDRAPVEQLTDQIIWRYLLEGERY